MNFLLLLLIAHFLGDFVLQPTSWVKSKFKYGISSSGFWKHIATHALLLLLIGFMLPSYTLALIIVLISHIIIDALKISLLPYLNSNAYKIYGFILDQIFHILAILIVAFNTSLSLNWELLIEPSVLLVLLGYIFLSLPSSSIMRVLLSPYTKEVENTPTPKKSSHWKSCFISEANEKDEQKSLKNGGKHIGIIERLLVFTFIIIGQWSAVGFLITAKSVFRFGDLNQGKNRQFTEYVLIGTLLSFSFAIFTALIVQFVLRLI